MYYVVDDGMGNRVIVDPTVNSFFGSRLRDGKVPIVSTQVKGDVTNQTSLNNTATGLSDLAGLHATLLAGLDRIATGTGNSASKQQPITAIARPWIQEPDNSDGFDYETSTALGVVGVTSVIVSFAVPFGYDGVINYISWNFVGGGFIQNSGDLVVQILRNGIPVKNYDNITVEKGTIQQPRKISPLRVYSGQVISMTINHVANVALNGDVVGSFVGYFYPSLS